MTSKFNTLGQCTFSDGSVLDDDELNDTIEASQVPIGGIIPWCKTFDSRDSGTTTSTTADKLVEAGQNFSSTVSVGDVVHNTTDDTFAYVTAVDSDTTLSLDSDIMASGEAYTIYATPALPGSYVECNGQTLSDASSRFNGATIPDLNGSSGTQRFLRGSTSSGSTGGSETHTHTWDADYEHVTNGGGSGIVDNNNETNSTSTLPSYYEVVWIMRVK